MRPLLLLTLALAAAGCPRSSPPRPDGGRPPECTSREGCDAGLVCTAQGFCDGCASSGQCRLKEQCAVASRTCELREGWGTDCAVNEQCPAGSWCKQGLCLPRTSVSLCPLGLSAECPTGERCNQVTLVCEEDLGCTTAADCSLAEVCNPGTGECEPRCTPETESVVCAALQRCVEGRCVQCQRDEDCAPGLTCDTAGRCSAEGRCYSDRDCPVPLTCLVQTGACLPRLPPCQSDDGCAPDRRCEIASGRCVPRTCQPDFAEPNNTPQTAFAVAPGTSVDLTLCAGDVDWYAVSLVRGDLLGVNIDADVFAENTFTTTVRDGTGRTVASGRFLVSYVAPAAGLYSVVVTTTDQDQRYDLTILKSRGTPCDDDGNEPNDTPASATALNATRELDGVVCPQDEDWFRLAVPAAGAVAARLKGYTPATGLLRLCLTAADGAQVLGCSSEPAPEVNLQLDAGTVLVRVAGDSTRVSNAYTLEVVLP